VTDLAALPAGDLLVGADGANSLVRRTHADVFQPTVEQGATSTSGWARRGCSTV
jgi:2-polyprenyl-6-methoxyphenol hydroxylase-like FAD-dependent oxidoreductase